MTHQALAPFARKLAETMCRVEFDSPTKTVALNARQMGKTSWVRQMMEARPGGWTQADHEAILDRPRVVEP